MPSEGRDDASEGDSSSSSSSPKRSRSPDCKAAVTKITQAPQHGKQQMAKPAILHQNHTHCSPRWLSNLAANASGGSIATMQLLCLALRTRQDCFDSAPHCATTA